MNNIPSSIIRLCIAIIGVPLLFYLFRFHGGLAEEQDIFGAFGDFINPFLTLTSIILVVYLSTIANRLANTFNSQQTELATQANQIAERYNKVQLRPQVFLDCRILPGSKTQNDESWIVKNAFDAPAINILVRFNNDRRSENWTVWTNCFSLERGGAIEIFWRHWPDVIEVMWTDIDLLNYYKIEYKDWSGTPETISQKEYSQALNEAKVYGKNCNFLNRAFLEYVAGRKKELDEGNLNGTIYSEYQRKYGQFPISQSSL